MMRRLDAGQVCVARGGRQAADDGLEPLRRDVLDIRDPFADRLHAPLVDVHADDLMARLEELDGERQADVAQPDDADLHGRVSVRIEYVANAHSGLSAAVEIGPFSAWQRALERGQGRIRVKVHEHVPARLDGLDPLGRVAQRHAGRPKQVGLLLHAAGVGEDGAGVPRELEEVEVAERRGQGRGSCEPLAQAGIVEPLRGPWVEREDHRALEALDQPNEPPQPVRVVDVPGAVRRDQQEATRLDAGGLERAGALGRDRGEGQRHVGHHVTDQVDLACDGLLLKVVNRRLRRAEQQVARMVGEDSVELLGHRPVERAHARLDMRQRHPRLRRGQGARERRVRVPVDEDELRPRFREDGLQRRQHPRGLRRVRAGPDPELDVRRGHPELLEEHARHLVVVVLSGVDERLVVVLAQSARDGGGLDELRPIADNACDSDSHRPDIENRAVVRSARLASRVAWLGTSRGTCAIRCAIRRASRLRAPPRSEPATPSPPPRCALPGAFSSMSSIALTGCTSRVVEARNASLA